MLVKSNKYVSVPVDHNGIIQHKDVSRKNERSSFGSQQLATVTSKKYEIQSCERKRLYYHEPSPLNIII